MLKKTIASEILPATRMCKCGKTVSINPIDDKTFCDKCGDLVYEDVKISSGGPGAESSDTVGYLPDKQTSAPT